VKLQFLGLFAFLTLGGVRFCAAQDSPVPKNLPKGTVYVQTQNTSFHVIDGVTVTVRRMNGFAIPRQGKPVSLDDKKSFTLQVTNAETYVSAANMSALLNNYILPHAETPIHNVTVSFDGQTILVKGSMKKGLDVPFEGKGTLSVTPDGNMRLHFTNVKVAGVLKKGLLDALGLKLSSVAQPKHQPSFLLQGDDVIISVMRLFPPPHIAGKLASVRIEGDQLVEVIGQPNTAFKPMPVQSDRFIYFRGGTMAFGKMTMKDADLELMDKDTTKVFDFSLDDYHRQLEAGYSKSLPNLGLVVYAADFTTLSQKK
jgi:hypothetical protein